MIKRVYLNNLKTLNGGRRIDWNGNIGCVVRFIYGEYKGEIKIVDYINKKLKIEYKDKIYYITPNSFKKCGIGFILGLINKNYEHEVGELIKVRSGKIKILEQIRMKRKNNTYTRAYGYVCLECGLIHKISESDLRNKVGCPVCYNIKTLKGYNDIATTNPELIKYFVNIEDTYNYRYSSHKKVKLKCPNCGYEKEMKINTLYYSGFGCNKCGDGISYSEKFMLSSLEQINIKVKTQINKNNFWWCDKYRYDFYFKHNNEGYIIETHGIQHYEKTNRKGARTLEEEQANDKIKKQLALNNGIKEENYIVIDCRKSELEFIKNNILHSRLNELFDLSKIDWLKAEEFACCNLVKVACDLWNESDNKIVKNIAEIMYLNPATLRKYLKKGKKLGWCEYDSKVSQARASMQCAVLVEVYKNDKKVANFESKSDMMRNSKTVLGVRLHAEYANIAPYGGDKTYKGYRFKFIDKKRTEVKL